MELLFVPEKVKLVFWKAKGEELLVFVPWLGCATLLLEKKNLSKKKQKAALGVD